MNRLQSLRDLVLLLSTVASTCLGACDDDSDKDKSESEHAHSGTGDAGASSDAGSGNDAASSDAGNAGNQADAVREKGPIILAERVFNPEGRLYYVSVLDEMPSGPVDRSQSQEFTSADIELYNGKLFVRDRESNTMTRYSVKDHGLVEEGRLSFQSIGLNAIRFYTAYVSPTRAFIMADEMDARMIEWNPSTMELANNEISLDFLVRPSLTTGLSEGIRVGDNLVFNVAWMDYDNFIMYPGTGALLIDPANPEGAKLIEDKRIAAGYISYLGAKDDAFLVGLVGGEYNLFGKTTDGSPLPASGVLRIGNGESDFDPDYFANVTDITKSPAIWAIHRIDERTLLVQMWDPEKPTKDFKSADELWDAKEYIYALVDTEDKSWKQLADIPRGGAGNSIDHIVDGRLYVQTYDDTDATIYAVSSTGAEKAFRVPGGDLWFLKRLQ